MFCRSSLFMPTLHLQNALFDAAFPAAIGAGCCGDPARHRLFADVPILGRPLRRRLRPGPRARARKGVRHAFWQHLGLILQFAQPQHLVGAVCPAKRLFKHGSAHTSVPNLAKIQISSMRVSACADGTIDAAHSGAVHAQPVVQPAHGTGARHAHAAHQPAAPPCLTGRPGQGHPVPIASWVSTKPQAYRTSWRGQRHDLNLFPIGVTPESVSVELEDPLLMAMIPTYSRTMASKCCEEVLRCDDLLLACVVAVGI